MNTYKTLLQMMSQAPDGQLDKTMAEKFVALANADTNPKASDIKEILDQCAYAALASEFVMLTLDTLWKGLLKIEGLDALLQPNIELIIEGKPVTP